MLQPASQEASSPKIQQLGRYRILAPLARGGMAEIMLARAEGPGGFERLVAVKTIHELYAKEHAFIRMFLDEARIAARIHHPHVVPVFEVGESEGQYFIAMDYVSGESIALILGRSHRERRSVPLDIALHLLIGAAEGLHAAHELTGPDGRPLGVIHRDVSPQNLLVGYDGIVRLTDFGVAKASNQLSSTTPGSQKGKYGYMAPEQLRSEQIDRRVDVFALGIVAWEMLTGKRLFKYGNDFTTARRVLDLDVPPPSRFRPECPLELDGILLKALAREPEHRYATARELGQALREFAMVQQLTVGTEQVEVFMSELFEDRRAERKALERIAASDELEGLAPEIAGHFATLTNLDMKDLAEPVEALEFTGSDEHTKSKGDALPMAKGGTLEFEDLSAVPDMGWGAGRWVFLGGLVVALFTIGFWVTQRPQVTAPPESSASLTSPPAMPARSAPAENPAPPPSVEIRFDVEPATAVVSVDGLPLDGALEVPRSDRAYEIEVTAPGHQSVQMKVTAQSSQSVPIRLPPLSKSAKTPPRKSKPSKARQTRRRGDALLRSEDL